MTQKELAEVLEKHKMWVNNEPGGKKADFHFADLQSATIPHSCLRGAYLVSADLRGAQLRDVDLRGADLRRANINNAYLCGADLRGANLDYSCWPLWCGSLDVKIDAKIAAQLVYHVVRACQSVKGSKRVKAFCNSQEVIALANMFHRVKECGKIEVME